MSRSLISAAVPISLDGQEYKLRYPALAFIEYAEQTGHDLLADIREIGPALQSMPAAQGAGLGAIFGKVRDLLWAGLLDAHPEIRREEVARIFTLGDLNRIALAIVEALRLTLPEQTERRPTAAPKAPVSRRIDGPDFGAPSAMDLESAPVSLNH